MVRGREAIMNGEYSTYLLEELRREAPPVFRYEFLRWDIGEQS